MKNQVLIIDSDIEVCKEIKYSLQNKNTSVYYTVSAKEALNLFTSHTYALVIMDIEHSETDGLELLQSLHKIRRNALACVYRFKAGIKRYRSAFLP